MSDFDWQGTKASDEPKKYTCAHCGKFAVAHHFFQAVPKANGITRYIFICPNCLEPTYFASEYGPQIPGEPFGNAVPLVPLPVNQLYEEARKCMTINAYAGAVLLCRKILMHMAVDLGAVDGRNFTEYVDFLDAKGYITEQNKNWVDHIRQKGNEANHKIVPMYVTDAQNMIIFTEMLLKLVYEFPKKAPPKIMAPPPKSP